MRACAGRMIPLVVALGCTTTQPPMSARPDPAPEARTVSLFPSDAAILSDEAIASILDTSLRLPDRARIALLHIDHGSVGRFWGWGPFWGAIAPAARQEVTASVTAALRSSPRIRDAATLPTFLLPEKPTVGHLREAAARTQVDLVLIYRTDCQAYQRSRLFAASQARAFCSAESALLDVRSGVVPFTSRALRDFTVEQQSSDAGFPETVRKAEAQAFIAALEENALAVVAFLNAQR